MNKVVTPYNDADKSKKEQVEEMFDNIAHRYDFLNHFLSLNIDNTWRRKAVRFIKKSNPKVIMDMASGTGDFAVEIAKQIDAEKVIGFDLSEKMLEVGRQKAKKLNMDHVITYEKGDSENMQYKDGTFDAMTVGFGVRNFQNLKLGLSEMLRVLKPGGKLAILEVSQPKKFPMKQIFGIYFHFILPTVGKLFSKDARAYSYLPESVNVFPEGENFVKILQEVGYKNVHYKALTFGTCAMYTCEK